MSSSFRGAYLAYCCFFSAWLSWSFASKLFHGAVLFYVRANFSLHWWQIFSNPAAQQVSCARLLSSYVKHPMADPILHAQLINAIPVIVGGILAILGGLASQFIIHRLANSRERMKTQRERIESLVKALYAHEQWVIDKKTKMIFRNEDHDDPAPLNEIRMLQALYFPNLAKEILAVQKAYAPMFEFISSQRIARMKDEKTFFSSYNSKPFDEAYKQHLQAAMVLTNKCRKLLNDYT